MKLKNIWIVTQIRINLQLIWNNLARNVKVVT